MTFVPSKMCKFAENVFVMKEKKISSISLEDAQNALQFNSVGVERDLILFDNVQVLQALDRPRQLGFVLHCICTNGSARLRLNARPFKLEKGDFLVGLDEQVVDECSMSSDFSGLFMLVSNKYSQESLIGLQHFWPYLVYLLENPILKLTDDECKWFEFSYKTLKRRVLDRNHFYRNETLISLLRVYYFDVANILHNRYPEGGVGRAHGYSIFDDFIRMLSENFRVERNVTWYSRKLCLTPKYLSEVVKRVSGRTAGQWISSMVIVEIKSLLLCSDFSIKEIAQKMNFPSQSFLGKYFKTATGQSPSEFRNSGK